MDQLFKGGPDYLPESLEKAIVVRVNDQEKFLLPRVIGMRDEGDRLFGAAVVLQDVTRFRLLDEVKSNLVSTVSHELKTPLTSVRMGLHLLLEERIGPLNAKQTELLLAAREESERLLRMINDLLDIAKLESGRADLLCENVEPRSLVGSAEVDMRPMVESRGMHLAIQVAPDLPSVFVDARQIGHVFSNLISNAAMHSKPGDENSHRSEACRTEAFRFSVTDHGPGIPIEHQARLFERFFRVPGVGSSWSGPRSRHCQGNRDRARRTNRSEQPARSGSGVLFRSPCGKGEDFHMRPSILIVDDEPNVRLTYRTALETEGLDVLGGARWNRGARRDERKAIRSGDSRYAHAGSQWPGVAGTHASAGNSDPRGDRYCLW